MSKFQKFSHLLIMNHIRFKKRILNTEKLTSCCVYSSWISIMLIHVMIFDIFDRPKSHSTNGAGIMTNQNVPECYRLWSSCLMCCRCSAGGCQKSWFNLVRLNRRYCVICRCVYKNYKNYKIAKCLHFLEIWCSTPENSCFWSDPKNIC